MRITTLAAFAVAFLMPTPALALEIDCPPQSEAQQAGFQRDDGLLDDELVRKRKRAREAELARAKEQWLARSRSQVQTAPAEQQEMPR